MLKAIVFDLDNTLENYSIAERIAELKLSRFVEKELGVNHKVFLELFHKYKISYSKKPNTPRDYSRALWMKRVFSDLKVDVSDAIIKKFEVFLWDEVNKRVRLFKNTRSVLSSLSKRFKLGLISDSDGDKSFKLDRIKHLGIKKYFKTIVTSDDTGFNKPDKRVFLLVLKRLRVKPEETIMVGDNLKTDMIGAKSVGMKTIWLMRGSFARKYYDRIKAGDKNSQHLLKFVDYKARDIMQVYKIIMRLGKN